jgi:metal-dependent amidase/aminoacylase/carboxypeptidase family protein
MQFDTESIRAAAERLRGQVQAHRRRIHRRPELGFAEHETARYIESVLDELEIPHRRVVGTGVVGVIKGDGPGCLGIRADMDALPVPEVAAGREGYRSEIEGVSHACGHDGHVAVLLGLAQLLRQVDRLPGTVVLYFQPAEEGPGGAEPMVAAGVLDTPLPSGELSRIPRHSENSHRPQAVIALHTSSRHQSGVVALRSGPTTGSDDKIRITVHGSGGHAAHPDAAIDAIPIAAQIVLAMQQFVAREVDPVQPVVVTFGTIQGGTRHNVIAPFVTLTGTMRAVHEHNRELLQRRVPEIARAVAATHRATATVEVTSGYPVGFNEPSLTELIAESARAVLGRERVIAEPDPTLGGEDFYAFGGTGLPVSMFLLGVANPTLGIDAPHHSSAFDLDETALPAGVAVFAEATRRWLIRAAEGTLAPDQKEPHHERAR